VSGYPVVIEGTAFAALVVGGGNIGSRRALALLDAGVRVHVVALDVAETLIDAARKKERLKISRAEYSPDLIADELLVIAATNDSATNAAIAADARARGRLVTVVSNADLGNCTIPAVHRAGDIVVAISAGGVPNAAIRLRDAIGETIDGRYAAAIAVLATLRRGLLASGRQDRWQEAAQALIGADFCHQVESGEFSATVARWR
jgi:siroheme synthase-like protein